MANLLQVRRGNEGIIQVSEDAYNSVYKGAGFNIVPSTTQTTIAPTGTSKGMPGTKVNTLPTSVLTDANRQTTANRVATPAYNVNSQGQSIASTQALTADPTQVTANASLTQQDRLLGPTEYNNLRTSLGVSDANFDKYFRRDGTNIYLKSDALGGMAKPPAQLAGIPGSTTKTLDASVLANTNDQGLELPTTAPTDFSAWINSLLSLTKSPEQTALEQQQGTMLTDIQRSYDKLQTIGDFSRQKEAELGITGDTAALKGINLQIAQKIGEYQQAQQNISQQPIAQGLLVGQSAALQRQAAIDVGVLQGQAEALRGNLELSYNLLDRAIAMEFEPIEQQIEATKFFLEQNKEQMSKEESKQAFKIEQMLQFRQEAVANAKAEKERVRDLMLAVTQAGGNPQVIDFNKSFEENLINAAPFLAAQQQAEARETDVIDYAGGKALIDKQTGEILQTYEGEEADTLAGLNDMQLTQLNQLRSEIKSDGDIQAFKEMKDQYNRIIAVTETPSAAGDIALIFNYMKMLDRNSTVREGEYATAANAGGVSEIVRARYNKLVDGETLSAPQRADFVNQASNIYQAQKGTYDSALSFYQETAEQFGIPFDLLGRDITTQRSLEERIQVLKQRGQSDTEILNEIASVDPLFAQQLANTRKAGNMDDSALVAALQKKKTNSTNSFLVNDPAINPGVLASTYESSGRPEAIGYDSTGGKSYGIYQLAHGSAEAFIKTTPFASAFNGLKVGTKAFDDAWAKTAKSNPEGFANAQHDYIQKTHLFPQLGILSKAGLQLEKYSPVLMNVIFSTAVQHGANTKIIANALKAVGKDATEEELIKKIYEYRWSGGASFKSSTEAVKKAVYNRFFGKDGELKKALTWLKNRFVG